MTIYRRILSTLRPYRKQLALSVVCSLLYSTFSGLSIYLTIPLLETLFTGGVSLAPAPASTPTGILPSLVGEVSSWFQRLVFRPNPVDSLLSICLFIIGAFVVKNVFGYAQSTLMTYVEHSIIRDLRNGLYRHLHKLPLAYFSNERTGALISRVTFDVPMIISGVSAAFFTAVREPLLILAYLSIAFAISWQLTLLAFLVFPLAILVATAIGRKVHKQAHEVQERMADLTSILQETMAGVKVVKAFGMENFESQKFQKMNARTFRTMFGITKVRNIGSPAGEIIGALAGAAVVWYGGLQVLEVGTLRASEFLGFLFAIFQLLPPLKELSTVNNRVQEATAAGKRVFDVLDTMPNIMDVPGAIRVEGFTDRIEFRRVSFRYGEGDIVLADIDLTIRKGEVVAIVGPSGSGKSTLVDLVPRFYDPASGVITLDGKDLRSIQIASLRDLIGIVTQETILFNDTVRSNIAYGLEACPLESIVAAARAANAHAFIADMPHGYDTVIGERGVKISGGERQRLALARAILKNPPILILDEATSALDTESEILVQEAIEHLMAGRTSIVIAHRLSTVQHADRIIVLEAGRIVESGRHEELLKGERGLYRKLYDLQFRV